MSRDDDETQARRRAETRKANTPAYWSFSTGVVRPLGMLAIAIGFGAVLVVTGPSTERRLVGAAIVVVGCVLGVPGWRWYRRRRSELTDPPRLRNELPLTTTDLLAIAFMFAVLGLVLLANGAPVIGGLLLVAAAGTLLAARSGRR